MRINGLLIAVVALAALAGGVYWSSTRKPDESKASADAPPKVLTIPDDQIKQLELKKKDGETTVIRKSGAGKWEIASPKPLAADQEAVNSLAGTFSSLTADRLIEEKASDLTPYGLSTPTFSVSITKKDNKTQKLLLGDDTPTGSAVFAKLEGDPRVFTLPTFTKTSLDKAPKDLRDKRLLTFDSEKLSRVELNAKKQNLEFGKNSQNEWQVLRPKPLRADGWQVEELVRKLKDAKMDTAISDEDAAKTGALFAKGTPVASAKVTDAAGTQQLEVRKNIEDYYAKSSAVEGVHKVTSELGTGLDKSLDDFRNKKLFDFGFNDPTKIEVAQALPPAKPVSLQKANDKWMAGSKEMDSTSVQALIDKLRDLAATKFSEQSFSGPILEVTVTSKEGKRVEKVLLSKQGTSYFAKRDNEPAVYEMDTKAAEDLQKATADVKEAQAAKPAAKKK